jgi:subtilisin family serine protease
MPSFFLALFLSVFFFGAAQAEDLPYAEGEALVKFRQDLKGMMTERLRLLSELKVLVRNHYSSADIYRVKGSQGERAEDIVRRLRQDPAVEYAEPNYKRSVNVVVPNDPSYPSQWGLERLMCPEAWEIATGDRSIVIGIADSGIDYQHVDLSNNLWRNPGEDWVNGRPGQNGVDDDDDGYIDNYYGINTRTGSGDPSDDQGHGTHVAGIIGAEGNNSRGVSGVNWRISIMALKFIGQNGFGTVADEIEAIEFARRRGVRVMNLSFGSPDFSTPERDAIAGAGGILFIAAAGNEGTDNDVLPSYPAGYDLPNVIAVANSVQTDSLAFSSNFGLQAVAVAAPGQSVLSTIPNNLYDTLSGSSMSTAFVSGLASLILASTGGLSVSELRDQILMTADVTPGLEGRILTGRINALRALTESVSEPNVFRISPGTAAVGGQVTIRGAGFGNTTGQVLFDPDVEAAIISWRNDKIVCVVPESAFSGPVRVKTVEGTSRNVAFSVIGAPERVIPSPYMVKILFPEGSTRLGEGYYLVISNLYDHTVSVTAKVFGESGRNAVRPLSLSPNGKILLSLLSLGVPDESVFVQCESEEFFGATLARIEPGTNFVIFLPAHVFVERP